MTLLTVMLTQRGLVHEVSPLGKELQTTSSMDQPFISYPIQSGQPHKQNKNVLIRLYLHICIHTYAHIHTNQRKKGYQFEIWGTFKGLERGTGREKLL